MKKILILVAGSLLLMQPLEAKRSRSTEKPHNQTACCPSTIPPVCCPLKTRSRELWNDHTRWTRDFILDSLSNSPAAPFAAARLIRNQVDLGNFIACFYGEEAGRRFTELLIVHVEVFVEIVAALQAGDQQALDFWNNLWRQNAQDISRFLSEINPCIKEKEMLALFLEHLAGTEREVVLRLAAEWELDVQNYDAVVQHINKMSDYISNAINRQFPDKCCDIKKCEKLNVVTLNNVRHLLQVNKVKPAKATKSKKARKAKRTKAIKSN